MDDLKLPLFIKDHDEIHLRYERFPLFFGPNGSHLKLYPRKGRIVIPSHFLTLFVSFLPTIALFLSVAISLYTDFAEATKTHCHVFNVLPSISTAISNPWTKPIWKTLIYLHSPPRFLAYLIYRRWFLSSRLSFFCCLFYLIELLSLLSLTHFDSTSAHFYHVVSFTTFGVFSVLHMIVHTSIVSNLTTRRSIQLKRRSLLSSLLCLSFCFLLFLRHNSHCEPLVFSVFAAFEYLFVLSNIYFHSTFRFDFPRYSLVLF